MSLTPREIIAAAQDGKKINELCGDTELSFSPLSWDDKVGMVDRYGDPTSIDTRTYTYEIAEELKEFWVNIYPWGTVGSWNSKEEADTYASHKRIRCIHVKEVIEDE